MGGLVGFAYQTLHFKFDEPNPNLVILPPMIANGIIIIAIIRGQG